MKNGHLEPLFMLDAKDQGDWNKGERSMAWGGCYKK